MSYSGFSRQSISVLRYLKFAPGHAPRLPYGFSFTTRSSLLPVLSSPAHTFGLCPHSSVIRQYRNFNLLSIGYVSPPLLRSRLTRGRSALPRNPWIFGQEDSHLFLATHSGILSSRPSTAPCRYSFGGPAMLPYQLHGMQFPGFGGVFQPRTFSARDLSTSELLRTL